jgi:hypothetical protein
MDAQALPLLKEIGATTVFVMTDDAQVQDEVHCAGATRWQPHPCTCSTH